MLTESSNVNLQSLSVFNLPLKYLSLQESSFSLFIINKLLTLGCCHGVFRLPLSNCWDRSLEFTASFSDRAQASIRIKIDTWLYSSSGASPGKYLPVQSLSKHKFLQILNFSTI
ncbi:hypothetical protein HanIR_Chr07g0318651 [Helianthus annuus]|nr:hypothetical protein HanIR_Chr07g0318651 [Helianthus annuus]